MSYCNKNVLILVWWCT